MRYIFQVLLVATVLFVCGLKTSIANETITLAADEWAPYNIRPGVQPEGYMIDVAREIFGKHGIKVEYHTTTWKRVLEGTKNGIYSAAVGATRDDAPYLLFPDESLAIYRLTYWARKDTTWRYTGEKSLEQISLGVIDWYNYGLQLNRYINRHHDKPARVQVVSGNTALEMNLRKLQARRIEATVDNEDSIRYTARQLGILHELMIVGREQRTENCYIAFSPAIPKGKIYARMLSEGIRELRRNGRLQQILATYGLKDWK